MSAPIRRKLTLPAAIAGFAATAALIPVTPATAATTVTAKGAGFGHGIGMSQYGANGQARAGRSASQILAHYYRGTKIETGSSDRTVRILLQTANSVRVKGVSSISGSDRRMSVKTTYVLQRSGSRVLLRSRAGRTLATASSGAMRLNAPSGGALEVSGRALNGISNGSYRGAIEMRGTYVINQLTLEDYIRGVVAGEMPSSWPAAALQAQAIAARTYAITTAKSSTFDHYPDTRSQVYRGVAGETDSTDAAIKATTGKFVTYDGKPIATYYFSTSGGQTENVEYSWPGSKSAPYLKSVKDPWDKVSPVHRWNIKYSRSSLQSKLGSWVKGSLRSIDVVKRGVSPRIVHADIVGSRGKTRVTGPELRARLGLRDTWVQFVFSGAKTKPLPTPSTGGADDDAKPTTPGNKGSDSGGVVASRLTPATGRALADATKLGAGMAAGAVARGHVQATGRVWPGGGKKIVRLQKKIDGRWRTVQRVRADERGNWSALIPSGSVRRVVALGTAGPIIRD